jgi:N,N'-diacetyl-8-epilegionaminate cytidylyltransferase
MSGVLAAVFARGGSKGVPRKNIAMVAGKPLLGHAIEAARASRTVDRIIVSTDDAEIADVARAHGAEVPFLRPAELASDKASEWLSWRHAIMAMRDIAPHFAFDTFVSVPATAPMRQPSDIDAAVEELRSSDADIVVTVTPAQRNPWFNMMKIDDRGYATLVNPGAGVVGRQGAPVVYDITTVAYAARPDYVFRVDHPFEGRVRTVVVPQERALDIDTPFDLHLARLLMESNRS